MKVNKGVNLLFTKVTKRELTKKGLQSKKETVVTELVTMELATFELFLNAYRSVNQTDWIDKLPTNTIDVLLKEGNNAGY